MWALFEFPFGIVMTLFRRCLGVVVVLLRCVRAVGGSFNVDCELV